MVIRMPWSPAPRAFAELNHANLQYYLETFKVSDDSYSRPQIPIHVDVSAFHRLVSRTSVDFKLSSIVSYHSHRPFGHV